MTNTRLEGTNPEVGSDLGSDLLERPSPRREQDAILSVSPCLGREQDGSLLRLHLSGDLCLSSRPLFERVVDRELSAWRPDVLRLDLAQVRVLAAEGLNAFVTLEDRCGVRLGLEAPSVTAARVLHLAGLDHLVVEGSPMTCPCCG